MTIASCRDSSYNQHTTEHAAALTLPIEMTKCTMQVGASLCFDNIDELRCLCFHSGQHLNPQHDECYINLVAPNSRRRRVTSWSHDFETPRSLPNLTSTRFPRRRMHLTQRRFTFSLKGRLQTATLSSRISAKCQQPEFLRRVHRAIGQDVFHGDFPHVL